jgi:hypothetical protein
MLFDGASMFIVFLSDELTLLCHSGSIPSTVYDSRNVDYSGTNALDVSSFVWNELVV